MAAPSPKQRAVALKRGGMDDGIVGAVLGISPADVRSLLYDADPDVDLGGDFSAVVQVATTIITDDEIKNDLDPGVEVLAAPPAGIVQVPVCAFLRANFPEAGYGNIGSGAWLNIEDPDQGVSTLTALRENSELFVARVGALLGSSGSRSVLLTQLMTATGGVLEDNLIGVDQDLTLGPLLLRLHNGGAVGPLNQGDPANTLAVALAYLQIAY